MSYENATNSYQSIFRLFLTYAVIVGCFSIFVGESQSAEPADGVQQAERNIIFFITDDESPTLGCYGDRVAVTPHIDALAKDGVTFLNAFATTASCSASRSVVMSGLHNHKNGQYGHQHHFHKFDSYHNVVSLALPRVLANEGYRTARVGKYHVGPEAVYQFEKKIPGNGRNAVMMAENCRSFITDADDRPFFLYFATSDPHRSGNRDENSKLELKPNLFGNKPDRGSHQGIKEVFYDPETIPIPKFLPDTPESRSELAQYYQSCSRIDQGLGRLIEILKEAGVYDKTLIVFTADHGMAFAGGKTTVYEGGLRVPFVVRDPYQKERGFKTDAMISHVDITPSLLDFAGGLDAKSNGPKKWVDPDAFWKKQNLFAADNRSGGNKFRSYHGKSWLTCLQPDSQPARDEIFASHTFHEITMYYPMRVYRDRKYKLIWNIANGLDYPFASDLWIASSWQAQYQQGEDAMYGLKTVGQYIHRPRFELYDIANDPNEANNLAGKPEFESILREYQDKLKKMQKKLEDPWIMKWDYE
ncbi:MAG: sulfatase [Planctomycetota bacterium]